MKSGYDQFFKHAKQVADKPTRDRIVRSEKRPAKKSSAMTSDEMVQHLRASVPTRRKSASKKSVPVKFIIFSFVGLGLVGVGYQKIDLIESQMQKVEVTLFGQALAEEAPKAEAKEAGKDSAKSVEGKTAEGKSGEGMAEASQEADKSVAKKEYSEEELNHLSKLNERKRDLDAREEELNKLEQEMAQQKEAVEKKMAELEATRKSISSVLEEKVQADDKKIENLVQVYSTMKPPQAAKALEEMDENLAIEIFGRMKKKNAAEILNLVKAEKVKIFSEKYAGYKQK